MAELKTIVRWILMNEIETRSDDDLLCALVDARCNPDVINKPYVEVRKNASRYGLYSTESITRCRRELQEEDESLKGCDFVTRMRSRRERKYREYYREKKADGRK